MHSFFGSPMTGVVSFGNIGLWGFLFVLNYLGIYGIIVAFWIEIKLTNTLWTLLAISLPTLFFMNKGLTPEGCHISTFTKTAKSKNN